MRSSVRSRLAPPIRLQSFQRFTRSGLQTSNSACVHHHRYRVNADGKPPGAAAKQCQTHPGLLLESLLVAFLAGGELAVEAVIFYLVAYFITTLGAFGMASALSTDNREAEDIDN